MLHFIIHPASCLSGRESGRGGNHLLITLIKPVPQCNRSEKREALGRLVQPFMVILAQLDLHKSCLLSRHSQLYICEGITAAEAELVSFPPLIFTVQMCSREICNAGLLDPDHEIKHTKVLGLRTEVLLKDSVVAMGDYWLLATLALVQLKIHQTRREARLQVKVSQQLCHFSTSPHFLLTLQPSSK